MRLESRPRSWPLALAILALGVGASKCYGQLPAASDILARFVAASGGESAIRSISTRAMKGQVVTPAGAAPLEIIETTRGRFRRTIDSPAAGRSVNGYDGTIAWTKNETGTREMTGPSVGTLSRELDIHRPLAMSESYASLSMPRADTLLGVPVFVVNAKTNDGVDETLYFDRRSGLLVGWDTTIAGTTLRNRLEDYRAVDGVMLPFRIRRSRPDFAWEDQFTEIRQNVQVDSMQFRKP